MLNIDQQIAYLNEHHHISTNKDQVTELRNMGYYHGYKGYRFVRNPNKKIHFTSFDEIIALNKFDLELKSLFYPKVMFIENALKSYVIEAVLNDAQSENLDVIFEKSITDYKASRKGSDIYHKKFKKRLGLKGKINSALIRDYGHKSNDIVNHFFDADKNIPIWAIFESITLGEFGTFFECANKAVKTYTSHDILGIPKKYDADGRITEIFIYVLKDLRNAIAHNSVIFDTRFQTGQINKRLKNLLEAEIGIINLDFKYIYAYVVLIVYYLIKMGTSEDECNKFLNLFISYTDDLHNNLPSNICNQILGTQQRPHLIKLEHYIYDH